MVEERVPFVRAPRYLSLYVEYDVRKVSRGYRNTKGVTCNADDGISWSHRPI